MTQSVFIYSAEDEKPLSTKPPISPAVANKTSTGRQVSRPSGKATVFKTGNKDLSASVAVQASSESSTDEDDEAEDCKWHMIQINKSLD